MYVRNKNVIITGGVGGMGYETSRELLNNGAKFVGIFDLGTSDGDKAIDSLREEFGGERVAFYPGDVANDRELEDNFRRVLEERGAIDILINNAGVADESDVRRIVDVNVKAVLSCSALVLRHAGKHRGGKGGVIVNVNAILGLSDCPILPFYSATKHAIIGFTRCMKDNFPATGVRVMSICPGVTKTNLIKRVPDHLLDFISDNLKERALAEVPVQSPKSVASAIIEIIEKGEAGAVWVVENDSKPFAVKPTDHYIRMSMPIEK